MSEPIFDAIKSGDIAQFNTALQASGAASARGDMNITPLMLAASLGSLEMVRALLTLQPLTANHAAQWKFAGPLP